MAGKCTSASIAITTLMAGVLALPGIVKMPSALADDPRDGIKSAVVNARLGSPCPPLNYSFALERDAQYAGRNPQGKFSDVGAYGGDVHVAIGTGDPARVATEQAMNSARGRIDDCSITDYGVDFQRFTDHSIFADTPINGSVDVIAIATGVAPPPPPPPAAPPSPHPAGPGALPNARLAPIPLSDLGSPDPAVSPPAPANPPAPPPPAAAPPAPTATVTSDVDLYNVSGGNGTIIGMLRQGQVVKVAQTCPSDDWCDLTDPKGSAWGSFLKNN